MICRVDAAVHHVLVLPLLDLELPPELPTSGPFFTLIHSARLEISDVNMISNSRFPVLQDCYFFGDIGGKWIRK